MLRDIAICIGLLFAGFAGGVVYADWRHPTRQDIADDLAEQISVEVEGVSVEASYESQTGPVVYASLADTPDEYVAIARIEISHEGEYLPSLWDKREGYYDYHWNKTMPNEELISAIRDIAQERREE